MAVPGLATVSWRGHGSKVMSRCRATQALTRRSASMAASVFRACGSRPFTISSAVPRLTWVELFMAAMTVSAGSWMGTTKERRPISSSWSTNA